MIPRFFLIILAVSLAGKFGISSVQAQQPGLVGGWPIRKELAEAAMLPGDIPHESRVGAHRGEQFGVGEFAGDVELDLGS